MQHVYDTSPNPGDELDTIRNEKPSRTRSRCTSKTKKGTVCTFKCIEETLLCRLHTPRKVEEEKMCRTCYNDLGIVRTKGLLSFYYSIGQEAYLCEEHLKELCLSASRYVI